jgi:hypothetical protein
MDEKTAALRDIFIDATGSETATERQVEGHGSLAGGDDGHERVAELVAAMRERFDFRTDLDDDTLHELVVRFHDGAGDADIAAALDAGVDAVARARLDLHLFREADREVPGFEAVADALDAAGADADAVATDCGVDRETVAWVRRVRAAEREAVRANHRFRDAFAEALTDADLSTRLARSAREDGLREAAEDIETDVSF